MSTRYQNQKNIKDILKRQSRKKQTIFIGLKYWRKKLYQFSTIHFKNQRQRYFLIHSMRPTLHNTKT